ncbi:MAG: Asp-tRNA(Asn)/Glu-tRNA(Gln) amidotransferase subunit GatC [Deltaproteobacteria bacterium]|nr:Asp-tRNA(Asn)/Glu-tRNA(Gln) amidotransferase subunit GatC [Deltaproteobacteria bacterium]
MSAASEKVPGRIVEADVRAVARLARLEVGDAEVLRMTDELACILAHVDSLAEVVEAPGFADLAPHRHTANAMLLRADEPAPSLGRDEALAAAPLAVDGGFAVPTFVDEG